MGLLCLCVQHCLGLRTWCQACESREGSPGTLSMWRGQFGLSCVASSLPLFEGRALFVMSVLAARACVFECVTLSEC